MWSDPKMNFWGEIDKAFWVNLIHRIKSAVFGCSLYAWNQRKVIERHREQVIKWPGSRRHNKIDKIYDNSHSVSKEAVWSTFKDHRLQNMQRSGFQFALLTCFESESGCLMMLMNVTLSAWKSAIKASSSKRHRIVFWLPLFIIQTSDRFQH